MRLFKRKDEEKLFEYVDGIAKKVACTYVALLVPNKRIQDSNLHQLADDKMQCAAAVFSMCCRQSQSLPERKKEVALTVLSVRTIHHLTNEIFSTNSGDYEQRVTETFNAYYETYYALSVDVFKIFNKLTQELSLERTSENQILDTLLITETVTTYISQFNINKFAKNINKLA